MIMTNATNDTNLTPYFKLGLSVDCVVFGLDQDELKVLLIERGEEPYKGYSALPGNLVHPDEDMDESAVRVLKELTGLEDIYLDQVRAFGKVNRHPAGRVVTMSYYALIKITEYDLQPQSGFAKLAEWKSFKEIEELAFDHYEILQACYQRLQHKVLHEPIGFNLLPEKFTLTHLQFLYQAILDKELDKRNFRKKILGMNLLVDLKEQQQNVSHRPAKLYSFDEKRYHELEDQGFSFEI